MNRRLTLSAAFILVLSLLLSGCTGEVAETKTASGTLSALTVGVVPELSGKVLSVQAEESNHVEQGAILITLDDELLLAQYEQTDAARQAAEATVTAAEQQLAYANAQYELALQAARAQDIENRQAEWSETGEEDFRPTWYFEKEENIAAAQTAMDNAKNNLETRQSALEKILNDLGNKSFIDLEKKLNTAQTKLTISNATLQKAIANNDENLVDAAQSAADLAQSEFDTALKQYNDALTTTTAQNVTEARAQVAAAQSSYDFALDSLMALQTGEQSQQVKVAETGVGQAEAALEQAKANLTQAEAALKLMDLQLERTQVTAPITGTILTRSVEVGDIAAAGGTLMTIARLEELELVVFVPETWYGQITLGSQVSIKVDSFQSETFKGEVIKISDQAEFTPRNVQTADGRATTVYAITIRVPNSSLRLKPGMPVDVEFN